MKPTIKDVAKKAGVSISTASRVLNQSGYASEITRKKVLDAASEVSFNANYFARGLKGKNPGIIGLINKDQLHPFFSIVSHGIEQEARLHDLGVMSVCSEANSKIERTCIDMLLDRNVNQMIFATVTDIENITYAQNLGVHCILIERDLGYSNADRVLYNNLGAGELIANIFYEKQYSRIGFVGMDTQIGSIEHDRYLGFKERLKNLGIPLSEDWDAHNCSFYSAEAGYTACEGILNSKVGGLPEALMVGSDFLLVGVLDYLSDHGISVPEDISLISADNFYTEIMQPRIDSIDYSLSELGKEAIGLVEQRAASSGSTSVFRTVVINPSYVERSSLR